MNQILIEAKRIACLAGDAIRKLRDANNFQVSWKSQNEIVTTADMVSNEIIRCEILKRFPGHIVISEEEYTGETIEIEKPTWIVDPIDGTVGYVNGHYQVAVSIAYAEENQVKVAVVYNPFLNELFWATEKDGAFLNNQLLRITEKCELRLSVIGTGIPHKRDDLTEMLCVLGNILPKISDIRRLGSPALDICWVACGRLQGFFEEKLFPWDIAASRFIAEIAGAKTGHYSKAENSNLPEAINGNFIIVSNPNIYNELLEGLTNYNQ